MKWFRRAPSPEKKAVEAESQKLDVARYQRQTALNRLLKAIETAPLDDALLGLSSDIGNSKKGGH